MAKSLGEYKHRFLLLPCVLVDQAANGQEVSTWPDPPATEKYYQARRLALTGGEQIVQGLSQSTGTQKIGIRGGNLPIAAVDRLKNVITGELWSIIGVARDWDETVLTLERAQMQTTAQ